MKNKLLYISASLFLLSASFRFDEHGITWLWEDKVPVPIILISTSIVLLGMHIYKGRKQSNI